jgi:hypothetical protein
VAQVNGQRSDPRQHPVVQTHRRALLRLFTARPERQTSPLSTPVRTVILSARAWAPDLRPPRSNVDEVLGTMNHLPARQHLAVIVAAIDPRHEAIDAPADVDRVVHACLDHARNER